MSVPYSAVVQDQRDPQAREFESLFSGPSAGSGPDSSTITAPRHEADNPTLSLNATELTNCFNNYTQNNDNFSCILPEEESAYQDSLYLVGEWEYLKGCDTSSAREESAMDPALDKSDSQELTREQNLHRNRGDSGYHSLSSYNELEINHRESMSLNSPVPGLQDTSTSDDRGALLDGAGLKSQAIDLGRGRYRVDPVPRERKSLERDPVQLDSHEPDMRCSSNGANTPWDPSDAKGLSTWDYLHQVVRIFSEDSSAYDPLSISWDIRSAPLSVCSDARLWKFHRQARGVLLNMNGTEASNVDSYASLKQIFGIAPDENERVPKSPSALCTKRRRANSPPSESAGTVPLSTSNQGVTSPPCMSRQSPGMDKAPRTTVHATQNLDRIDEN
ncbi:hypothetical protein E8E14_007392 [Neopestalotiopsis sp. 37M]|nr:hypothetical protein E8E14_007392 [Neopestalotiopsis sp. 37M]